MKIILLYILIILGLNGLSAQTNSNLYKIDSIHKHALNTKIKDSTYLAKIHYTLGELYRYANINDSAYYYYHKSEKFYKNLNYRFEYAKTLYGIAVIQKNGKDFTGSEATSFQAISILESLTNSNNVNKYEAYVYNNLGIIFNELNLFDESFRYFKKSIEIKKSLNGDFQMSIYNSVNNMARAYSRSGNYVLALKYYNQVLDDKKMKAERSSFYAMVLGNYAHNLYLSKKGKELPDLYFKALKIADSINPDGYNSITINQYIAEYYHDIGNSDLAKLYAYKTKSISENNNNSDLLKSLLLLSKIEEGDKAIKHLNDYIKLNDSLFNNERSIRNKFERIRFETKQIKQENVQIAKERMWLLIISVILIITSLLIYILITQRTKNQELQFLQKQQETNEEIYNLMLSQQDNIEEARVVEKKRISEELHDGVLGRLFGARLSLDSLNMGTTREAIDTRSQYINELKTIEEDIRKVSHELNTDFIAGSGFIDIIKNLIETQALAYDLRHELYSDDSINWDGVSNKSKIHIYRIIQEAFHNIYKHAEAITITIRFELKNSLICLNIIDDGSGFDVSKAKSGIGLKNMNSRIAEINGKIDIVSEKNIGTNVSIEIPIT